MPRAEPMLVRPGLLSGGAERGDDPGFRRSRAHSRAATGPQAEAKHGIDPSANAVTTLRTDVNAHTSPSSPTSLRRGRFAGPKATSTWRAAQASASPIVPPAVHSSA